MRHVVTGRLLGVLASLLGFTVIQACAPGRSFRTPSSRDGVSRPGAVLPSSSSDDRLLLAKITPRTPPHRAASLRLTDEARRLLDSRQYRKALARLEKTLAIDSGNPYAYYYLGKTHYHLEHYRDSLNFLDVAESLLSGRPYWLADVLALKGENFRALGLLKRAGSSYSHSLRLDPGNRLASEGLRSIGRKKVVPRSGESG